MSYTLDIYLYSNIIPLSSTIISYHILQPGIPSLGILPVRIEARRSVGMLRVYDLYVKDLVRCLEVYESLALLTKDTILYYIICYIVICNVILCNIMFLYIYIYFPIFYSSIHYYIVLCYIIWYCIIRYCIAVDYVTLYHIMAELIRLANMAPRLLPLRPWRRRSNPHDACVQVP